ncbi:glycosyltransferase family 4 protein [uncultured Chitinophaga sp.]|uniref:glycosyltransferase family 4 protein n=1 Tax=uncultured Chitinophaga sp. TaxID=339340 RepID=UPI0025DDF529|nr:glycosyltransferase family 4 protein [uncultured Chitinophaga sp.]
MNILFFTHISPFPQNGGEKLRSYYLLKALSELGHRVFAVIRNEEQADLTAYSLENVTYYTHPDEPLTLEERLTGSHYFKKSAHVLQVFKQICGYTRIDIALLDYGYVGHYIDFFTARNIKVILGTHNAQPEISKQLPARNLLMKIRKFQLVSLERLHERSFFKKAAAVLVVSDHDKTYHQQFIARDKVFVIPNFLDEREYISASVRKPRLLVMTANFAVYMNREGLRWFLQEVWDDALAAKYELLLVGRDSEDALKQITGQDNWKNVSATGKVPDVKQYIAMAEGVVIPLLHGSGTRLKCLEAMALNTPIISTSRGVEGVLSNNFIVADTAAEFKEALHNFTGSDQKGDALKEDFMKEYSATVNKKRISDVISYTIH